MSIPSLSTLIKEVVLILKRSDISFALVGGLAVTFRAYERTTKDIDFVILSHSNSEIEEIIRIFTSSEFIVSSLLENIETNKISTVRMSKADRAGLVVDFLFNACGIEEEVIQDSTDIEILPQINIPVASIASLIAMKVYSANPKTRITDFADLRALILEAADHDLKRAEQLAELINKRGYSKNKNLLTELKKLVKEYKEV